MTKEAQRIAMAEACGWKHEPDAYYEDKLKWFNTKTFQRGATCDLPDYLNDLNAMHEAEKVLTGLQQDLYADTLVQLLKPSRIETCRQDDSSPMLSWPGVFAISNAAAYQRSEAFLKTLGLWKD